MLQQVWVRGLLYQQYTVVDAFLYSRKVFYLHTCICWCLKYIKGPRADVPAIYRCRRFFMQVALFYTKYLFNIGASLYKYLSEKSYIFTHVSADVWYTCTYIKEEMYAHATHRSDWYMLLFIIAFLHFIHNISLSLFYTLFFVHASFFSCICRMPLTWHADHLHDLQMLIRWLFLVQTQVATVIDYYKRWMEVCP